MTLDPAARELLQAIAVVLDVIPKPQTHGEVPDWQQRVTNRAAVVRHGVDVVLADPARQEQQARRVAAQLRRLAASQPDRPADPPLLTRPHDWPPEGGDR